MFHHPPGTTDADEPYDWTQSFKYVNVLLDLGVLGQMNALM
jgi:hypothetical protein